MRVCPSDPKDEYFEDINETANTSREGLYFITGRESYYPGMRLVVTRPYYLPTDPLNREYLGEVVRVEQLENCRQGVAVKLLTTNKLKPTATPARTQQK